LQWNTKGGKADDSGDIEDEELSCAKKDVKARENISQEEVQEVDSRL